MGGMLSLHHVSGVHTIFFWAVPDQNFSAM